MHSRTIALSASTSAPITVPLKLTSRFSTLKLGGDAARCTGCEACTQLCPMDIRVHEYTRAGQRVLSTECILCQSCVTACARQAIELKFGLDVGGAEKLRLQMVNQSNHKRLCGEGDSQ